MPKDPIEEMRDRLTARFTGQLKPMQGLRVTANDMPRLPQSRIPNPKPKYERAGRPPVKPSQLPAPSNKPKDIWGGWL